MNVELVGATDDPADPLDWHAKIAASNLATRVVPTFRPDAALKVQHPEKVQAWARRLGDTAGIGADTFSGLLAAIEKRHDAFAQAGCPTAATGSTPSSPTSAAATRGHSSAAARERPRRIADW